MITSLHQNCLKLPSHTGKIQPVLATPLIKISLFLGQGRRHVKFKSVAVLLKRLKMTKEQSLRKLSIKKQFFQLGKGYDNPTSFVKSWQSTVGGQVDKEDVVSQQIHPQITFHQCSHNARISYRKFVLSSTEWKKTLRALPSSVSDWTSLSSRRRCLFIWSMHIILLYHETLLKRRGQHDMKGEGHSLAWNSSGCTSCLNSTQVSYLKFTCVRWEKTSKELLLKHGNSDCQNHSKHAHYTRPEIGTSLEGVFCV